MIDNPIIRQINKTKEVLSQPDILDQMCAHIANGGSLVEMAKILGIRYSDVSNWIRSDKERSRRIDRAMVDRGEWTKERILEEFRSLAFTNINDAFDSQGNVKPIDQWPKHIAQSVKSIELVEIFDGKGDDKQHIGYTKKIQFWNKEKALELLGKNMQMFTEKIDVNHTLTLEEIIGQSFKEERLVNGEEDSSEGDNGQ